LKALSKKGGLSYLVEPISLIEIQGLLIRISAQRQIRLYSDETARIAKQLNLYHVIRNEDNGSNLLEKGLLEKIVAATCEAAVKMFNVRHSGCVKFSWDDSQDPAEVGKEGVVIAEYPVLPSGPMVGEKIPIRSVPIEEDLLYHKKPVPITDINSMEGFETVKNLARKHALRSMLIVPVIVGDRVVASFSLDMDTNIYSFSIDDIKMCEKIAGLVALAISKIEKAQELEGMRQAWFSAQEVAEVAAMGNFDNTMNKIVRTIVEDMEGEIATLYIFDEKSKEFVSRYVYGCDLANTAVPGKIPVNSTLRRIINLEGKVYHYSEDVPNDQLLNGSFVKLEDIKTSFAMKLCYGQERVGLLFINYRRRQQTHLNSYQINAFLSFGHQAAVSIKTTQLTDQYNRQTKMLDSLYAAGEMLPDQKNITDALNRIVKAAYEAVVLPGDSGKAVSYIALIKGNKVEIEAAWPKEYLEPLQQKVEIIDLDPLSPRGIIGRAICEEETQFEPDVTRVSHYIPVFPFVKAQIAVPLKVGKTVIGSLTIEHSVPPALTLEEKEILEHLAGHATSIIQASRQLGLVTGLISVGSSLEIHGDGKDIQRQLEGIADVVRSTFKCDTVFICSYDQQCEEATIPAVISGVRKVDRSFMKNLQNNDRIKIGEMSAGSSIRRLIQGTEDFVFAPDSFNHEVFRESETIIEEGYHSSVGIRLKVNREGDERIVGIMFLNFCRRHKFYEEEQQEIRLFAQYIVYSMVTVQINKKLAYIEDQNWIVRNQNYLQNQISTCVEGIKTTIQIIEDDLTNKYKLERFFPDVRQKLKTISMLASDISRSTDYPVSSIQLDIKLVDLYKLVKGRLQDIWDREWDNISYMGVTYNYHESSTPYAYMVEVNPEWLRFAIDLVIDIAVDCAYGDEQQNFIEVEIQSNSQNQVSIIISDHCNFGEELYLDKNIHWRVAKSIIITYNGRLSHDFGEGNTGNIYTLSLPVAGERRYFHKHLELTTQKK
jgi:GAF domain-containing protein